MPKDNLHYFKIAAAVVAGLFIYFNLGTIVLAAVLVGGLYYVSHACQQTGASHAAR